MTTTTSRQPSAAPTDEPSVVPTRSPSRSPTAFPSAAPTLQPTGTPSTKDNRCMGVLCSGHGTCTDPKVGNCVCDPGWFTPKAKLFLLSAHCSEVPVKVVATGTAQGCQSNRSLGLNSSTRLEGTAMSLEGSQTLACEANRTNWTSRSFVIIVRSSCRELHAVYCVWLLPLYRTHSAVILVRSCSLSPPVTGARMPRGGAAGALPRDNSLWSSRVCT